MFTMRITGGKYCNRKVFIPKGNLEIRPPMDRMRESLFSILGDINGVCFLDLFSGSACVALEAASRGAKTVHLVEMDRQKKAVMEKNISWAKDECDFKIFFCSVFRFIPKCSFSYNLIYADPPFPMRNKTVILDLVIRRKILKPQGKFVVHIPSTEDSLWPERKDNFVLMDTRKYGRNMLKFYKNLL